LIFRFGGLPPNLDLQSTDELGEFVELVELIAMRCDSTRQVKYSLRYSGSKKNLFPVAQPEPETEMPKIMVYSREVNKFYIAYKFHRYQMLIDGARRCQFFVGLPRYGFFGKIIETVKFDLKND